MRTWTRSRWLMIAVTSAGFGMPAPAALQAQPQELFDLQRIQIAGSADLANFTEIFDRGCAAPAAYRETKRNFWETATSPTAWVNALVSNTRNRFHVYTTDIKIYEIYYPDACDRASRMRQCRVNSYYSAEQACDCTEGYIGDVLHGAGAGEAIADAYHVAGERACRIAADRSTGRTRARYLAQLGRAQIYAGGGTYTGGVTLRQAISAGYGRANIDMARAYLRDVEFGGGSAQSLQRSFPYLAAARAAGAREVPVVVESMDHLASVRRWNQTFAEAWMRYASP